MTSLANGIREDFKTHFEAWSEDASKIPALAEFEHQKKLEQAIVKDIQEWSESIEKEIQMKISFLEKNIQKYHLKDDYLRTTTESLIDLDTLRRNKKTFFDIAHGENIQSVLHQINHHYFNYLVPLLNILSRLEHDYLSIANREID